MIHKHHIIPRYMGGADDESNIIELTVEEHAEAHFMLWKQYGDIRDYLAWNGLEGLIDKTEIVRELQSLGGKKGTGHIPPTAWTKGSAHTIKASKHGNDKIRYLIDNDPSYSINRNSKISKSSMGKKWVNLQGKTKRISSAELETYLNEGWLLGRKTK